MIGWITKWKDRLIVGVVALGIIVVSTGIAYITGHSNGKQAMKEEMVQKTLEANQRAEELLVENSRIRRELALKNTKKVSEYVATTDNRECLDAIGVELFNLPD